MSQFTKILETILHYIDRQVVEAILIANAIWVVVPDTLINFKHLVQFRNRFYYAFFGIALITIVYLVVSMSKKSRIWVSQLIHVYKRNASQKAYIAWDVKTMPDSQLTTLGIFYNRATKAFDADDAVKTYSSNRSVYADLEARGVATCVQEGTLQSTTIWFMLNPDYAQALNEALVKGYIKIKEQNTIISVLRTDNTESIER